MQLKCFVEWWAPRLGGAAKLGLWLLEKITNRTLLSIFYQKNAQSLYVPSSFGVALAAGGPLLRSNFATTCGKYCSGFFLTSSGSASDTFSR